MKRGLSPEPCSAESAVSRWPMEEQFSWMKSANCLLTRRLHCCDSFKKGSSSGSEERSPSRLTFASSPLRIVTCRPPSAQGPSVVTYFIGCTFSRLTYLPFERGERTFLCW